MKIKRYVGRLLYSVSNLLPGTFSNIKIGQGKIRELSTKLIVEKCGDNVSVDKNAVFPGNLELGEYSGIGRNARIAGKCVIGKYVMMGPDCTIYTKNHNFARTDIPMCMQGNQEERPVTIEDDVWIGGSVTILPGVTIKKGTIVAACSVVTRDTEEYDVVAGVPAKRIRNRLNSSFLNGE